MRVVEVMQAHREFFLIAGLVVATAAMLLLLCLVVNFEVHCTHCG
jgi:hypothetical protein